MNVSSAATDIHIHITSSINNFIASQAYIILLCFVSPRTRLFGDHISEIRHSPLIHWLDGGTVQFI